MKIFILGYQVVLVTDRKVPKLKHNESPLGTVLIQERFQKKTTATNPKDIL